MQRIYLVLQNFCLQHFWYQNTVNLYSLLVHIKWPKSIDLATSYSYNSGHGHEIYLKTSSNSSKLLQTPPDTFQTLPNPVQTCPNPVQMRPNTSKCVKTCPNASKCSKLVQTWSGVVMLRAWNFLDSGGQGLFRIISPYWPLVSIAFWTIFIFNSLQK